MNCLALTRKILADQTAGGVCFAEYSVRALRLKGRLRVAFLLSSVLALCLMALFPVAVFAVQDPLEPTIEEIRGLRLGNSAPELDRLVNAFCEPLENLLRGSTTEQEMDGSAIGSILWERARKGAQNKFGFDDRILYWCRLRLLMALKDEAKRRPGPRIDVRAQINALEWNSRGLADVGWKHPDALRAVITGFDPFALDNRIDQANPSGLVALSLDGKVFKLEGRRVEINASIFPVRYGDFDQGMFEIWLTEMLLDQSVDLFVSISMGRDQFDLERFPGRRRSASALDNVRKHAGSTSSEPVVPLFKGMPIIGPEFLEFSLPAEQMIQVGGAFSIRDNHQVTTVEKGTFEPSSLAALAGLTAVRGSGGGYLSNEIAYRALRLANELDVSLPMGHIHTPRMQGYNKKRLQQILDQVEAMIVAASASIKNPL